MRIAQLFHRGTGSPRSVRFEAYDGSRCGPAEADVTIRIRSPRALSYATSSRGSLGLARAYVTGDLEIVGDTYEALRRLSAVELRALRPQDWARVVAAWVRARLERVEPPPEEVRLSGSRFSRERDARAIAHHYDVSNRFYELVLGPSMSYTCAVFPREDATLEEAQEHKHELVARKLDLQPGMTLLDVGCGWGGMVRHAAREHGVKAVGFTLSRQQAMWAAKQIAEDGLADLAEVRHGDYREATGRYDAVSSIGLTEHIGLARIPAYFDFLLDRLEPGGRLLNHCITRPSNHEPPVDRGGFLPRYVFPDAELASPGYLVSAMHDAGFEVRHSENIREHYALTLRHWSANLERHWDEAVADVGERKARVWRLYMAGVRLGFERNATQLHQILGVRLAGSDARMPLRPSFEPPAP